MRKYLSFFRICFVNGLQYRAAAYAGIVTQFAWGFMELLMFRAFYKANAAAFPMEFSRLSSYIWLQQALLAIFMTWFLDNEIFSAITSGNIAYELSRPMDLYNMWFTKNLAIRLSKAVLRCMPILAVAAFLPGPYRLSLPVDLFGFLMFILTMILAFFCVVAFCMLIYITTFYTLSPFGIRIVALSLTEFLTGAVIPLPFLPDGVRKVVELTPFASMQN
jgi:ABC-2 type transport system permease protein